MSAPNQAASERGGIKGLVENMLEAQAEERERIARELHDETGQTLTALLVGLRALEERVADDVRSQVGDLRRDVRELIESVGRLARGLHPPALGELALSQVLRQQVSEFEAASKIDSAVAIDAAAVLDALPRPHALALYRIIQEALTNVWKHAGATHVQVDISTSDGWVRLSIHDDGNGLAHRKPEGRGLGMRIMRRRVESLGGDLTIDAVVGEGTTVRGQFPLPEM